MATYIYSFDIKGKTIDIESYNLESACNKLLGDEHGFYNFKIERRGNFYLQSTPFNDRTHIVRFNDNGTTFCNVRQKKVN